PQRETAEATTLMRELTSRKAAHDRTGRGARVAAAPRDPRPGARVTRAARAASCRAGRRPACRRWRPARRGSRPCRR
ncbi:hypothetical protein ACWEP3_26760, partial [Streptomyces albidoflavus]